MPYSDWLLGTFLRELQNLRYDIRAHITTTKMFWFFNNRCWKLYFYEREPSDVGNILTGSLLLFGFFFVLELFALWIIDLCSFVRFLQLWPRSLTIIFIQEHHSIFWNWMLIVIFDLEYSVSCFLGLSRGFYMRN